MQLQTYEDLAPKILRQRLVIEGYPAKLIGALEIKLYLCELSVVLDMVTLTDPATHCCEQYGWAGWIHWSTSGAHFYAWERPQLFFSVDIYTCKAFEPAHAVEFTRQYFEASRIIGRSF